MNLERLTIAAGGIIFLEGDKEECFFIVEEGRVEIFTDSKGQFLKLTEVGPGESFGEFAMLTNTPRSASARAMTDVQLVRVSPEGYEELLNGLPGWASSMLRSFAERLRESTARLK